MVWKLGLSRLTEGASQRLSDEPCSASAPATEPGPEAFSLDEVEAMGDDPILRVLANPQPEVDPVDARASCSALVASGRLDLPDQVNNVLAFPGLSRGGRDGGLEQADEAARFWAAQALAELVPTPDAESTLAGVLARCVVPVVGAGAERR